MMIKYLLLSLTIFFSACQGGRKVARSAEASQLVVDGKLWSSLFQQRAAEYKALCYQAFNIARLQLDASLQSPAAKPKAIITDIDETFLDNSPYAVQQALQGKDYEPATWANWTSKGIADTLAGSLSFFKYAASRQVEVFYITNRDEQERAGTLQNLLRFGFPFADNAHLVMRKDASSKESRRMQVAQTHEIILLMGDNLGDFSAMFDKKTEIEREQNTRLSATEFGKRFIVFPNANYGGWEEAVYQNSRNWTPAQKDSLIRSVLKGY